MGAQDGATEAHGSCRGSDTRAHRVGTMCGGGLSGLSRGGENGPRRTSIMLMRKGEFWGPKGGEDFLRYCQGRPWTGLATTWLQRAESEVAPEGSRVCLPKICLLGTLIIPSWLFLRNQKAQTKIVDLSLRCLKEVRPLEGLHQEVG